MTVVVPPGNRALDSSIFRAIERHPCTALAGDAAGGFDVVQAVALMSIDAEKVAAVLK
jgi:hypothetical protein